MGLFRIVWMFHPVKDMAYLISLFCSFFHLVEKSAYVEDEPGREVLLLWG